MEIGSFSVALVMGVLSTLHCWGMCGGLLAAFALGGGSVRTQVPIALAYQGGRVTSYVAAGTAAGSLAGLAVSGPAWGHSAVQLLAAVVLIVTGLSLTGMVAVPAAVQRVGLAGWRRLQPFTRHFLPVDSAAKAYAVGLIWGWVPCGLVYSMLAACAALAAPGPAALTMLGFGLGTVPGMLFAHLGMRQLRAIPGARYGRSVGGCAVIALGVAFLWLAWPTTQPDGGAHVHHHRQG
jgi:sulfite exporter TauE/SafE